MSDIKLFRIKQGSVQELSGSTAVVEKSLQDQLERDLESFLGVRFLASEYNTGAVHGGRIDTLGIDENGCPVIIEYKRATNENVINQGLFYLDWLMDHQGEFQLLVQDRGADLVDQIEWSSPRLICVAGGYTKYDLHAVSQIDRNIELFRYAKYGGDLLMLELVNARSASNGTDSSSSASGSSSNGRKQATFVQLLAKADQDLTDLYKQLCDTLRAFGDDVQEKQLKYYRAFKRIKNFACIEVKPQIKLILVYLKVHPNTLDLEDGFSRDVSNIGHFGTGDLELTICSSGDLHKALPLLQRSYEDN